MATSPLFSAVQNRDLERHSSVLPVLTGPGNLLAGATTRVTVGFALNPFSVLKARYEVRKSLSTFSVTRTFMTPNFFLSVEQPPCVRLPDVFRAVHRTRWTFGALSRVPCLVSAGRALCGSILGVLRGHQA
jgi:hypothetical protein